MLIADKDKHELCAIDSITGQSHWTYTVLPDDHAQHWENNGEWRAVATRDDNQVLLCNMRALDLSSGKELWMKESKPDFTIIGKTEGGVAICATKESMFALDVASGDELWAYSFVKQHIKQVGVEGCWKIVGDFVIGLSCAKACAVEVATGKERWLHTFGRACVTKPDLFVSDVGLVIFSNSESYAYSACPDATATVRVLDRETGVETVSKVFDSGVGYVQKHVDGDTLYLSFDSPEIMAVRLSDLQIRMTIRGTHTRGISHFLSDGMHLFSASNMVTRTDIRALKRYQNLTISLDDLANRTKRFTALTLPSLDFRLKALLQAYTTLQLASFGFNEATVPENKELVEATTWARELGVSDVLYPTTFTMAAVFVLLLAYVFAVQESLEFRKWTQPDNQKLQKMWLAASSFCTVMSTAGFVPVSRTLARAGDCTQIQGEYWLDAMITNETVAPSGMKCYEGAHWVLALAGFLAFVLFLSMSARLIWVGGVLQNIELKSNPFDWKSDNRKLMPFIHALSPHSNTHAAITVAVKTVAVLASTFFTKRPVVVQAVLVVGGLALFTLTLKRPPFYATGGLPATSNVALLCSGANRARLAVDLAVFWVYVCSLVAAVLYANGSGENKAEEATAAMLQLFPIGVPVCLLIGWLIPSTCTSSVSRGCKYAHNLLNELTVICHIF